MNLLQNFEVCCPNNPKRSIGPLKLTLSACINGGYSILYRRGALAGGIMLGHIEFRDGLPFSCGSLTKIMGEHIV